MTSEPPTTLRVPAELRARIDALAERIAGGTMRGAKATVLRMALVRGVEALEREHGTGSAASRKPRRRG